MPAEKWNSAKVDANGKQIKKKRWRRTIDDRILDHRVEQKGGFHEETGGTGKQPFRKKGKRRFGSRKGSKKEHNPAKIEISNSHRRIVDDPANTGGGRRTVGVRGWESGGRAWVT